MTQSVCPYHLPSYLPKLAAGELSLHGSPLYIRFDDTGAELIVHNIRVFCIDGEIDVWRFAQVLEGLVKPKAATDRHAAAHSMWIGFSLTTRLIATRPTSTE